LEWLKGLVVCGRHPSWVGTATVPTVPPLNTPLHAAALGFWVTGWRGGVPPARSPVAAIPRPAPLRRLRCDDVPDGADEPHRLPRPSPRARGWCDVGCPIAEPLGLCGDG